MKKSITGGAGFVGAFFLVGNAWAGGFQEHATQCVDKYADRTVNASVILECTAAGGKLSACKVVDNTAIGLGFDKAAMCLVEFMPMGAKTGPIRVPLKFQASS